jgi:hypothetical protein
LAVALCHIQAEQARERFGLPDPKVLVKSRSLRGGSRTASGQRGHETPVSVAGI